MGDQIHLVPRFSKVGVDASHGSHRVVSHMPVTHEHSEPSELIHIILT